MTADFVDMLNEPVNTLGRTEEAVELVLANPELIHELYACYFQCDEWVRLQVSSAFKRLWKADAGLVVPFLDGFVNDVSSIDQPSVQWTFAIMCLELEVYLSEAQRAESQRRLQGYLEASDDWIVQNNTIATLGSWAKTDEHLKKWLHPRLNALSSSHRKSVAKRATKWAEELSA